MRSFDLLIGTFGSPCFMAVSPHKALISVQGPGIIKDRNLSTLALIDLEISDISDIVAFCVLR